MQPNVKHRILRLAVPVAAVLLLAACGSSDDKAKTTSGGGGTTSTTTAPTTGAAAAPVSTASNPTLGQILVDPKGLTVYVFDSDKNGTIACVNACVDAWPPVGLAAGTSLPTTGPLAADLTTVARPDGTQQVAYKGRPLYRYASDANAGDIKGDGLAGMWHVVKLSQAGGATTTTAARVNPY